ncbi:SHOCT domain-containing protein [Paraburkholderia sp. BR14320]|uniref:SHOCT domain-containing protein n=1 Tax=unclassified Paraburkholderia TaxID=2615204 RepID=UPI0034CE22D8
MKRLITVAATMVLTGCIAAPELDLSKVDSTCAQRCSSEYSNCTTGFKLFPLIEQAHCNEALKVCVAACTPAQTVTGNATSAQRLTELKTLYKQGLISEEEYETKRQEILKTM